MATNKNPQRGAAAKTTTVPPGQDPRGATPPAGIAPPPPKSDEDEVKPRRKKEALVSMTVHTPFKLQDDNGELHEYGVGIQDLPASHADHWYVKHHADRNED